MPVADEIGILNGRLLLTGAEGTWTSDGTREGTVLLTSASVPTASFRGLSPYEPGNVLVFPYSTPKTGSEPWKLTAPLGDTNFDLRVDLVDLNNVRDHLGGYGFGDADHDGDVDLDDFNAVRNQLGVEAPAGGEDRMAVSGAWNRDSSARDVLFAILVREEGGGKSKRAARGKF